MKVFESRRSPGLASINVSAVKCRLVIIGLASVSVLVSHGRARAKDPPCFSQAAVTMDPIQAGERDDAHDIDDGRVRLDGEELILRAPVFNVTANRKVLWTYFGVLYTDPDGYGDIDPHAKREPGKEAPRTNKARVQAVLKFMDESGSPPQTVVVLDSNDPEKIRAKDDERLKETRLMRIKIPEGKLNFEKNYYFVDITLTREKSRDNKAKPDVVGFQLCKQFN